MKKKEKNLLPTRRLFQPIFNFGFRVLVCNPKLNMSYPAVVGHGSEISQLLVWEWDRSSGWPLYQFNLVSCTGPSSTRNFRRSTEVLAGIVRCNNCFKNTLSL